MDILAQRAACFPPKLFVADMDSTMIGQECIDELAAEVGLKDKVAAITERAMRGELDFAEALRERLALLEGLEVSVIDRLLFNRITPNPGARELIEGLKAAGVRCVLVSGGFTHFAKPIGELLGFDRVVANRLGVVDGKLTGKVEGDIVDADTKRRVLLEEAGDEVERSVAIGDGANDLKMMEVAGLGIAYRAKPKVAAQADARLNHASLDSLLVALLPRA
ncbi:phosphoserine phosphatase SerB [Sphingomicrobium clamense]|uniref:phosphoserine phosphatase SerB n=1 Tax=Sphingomicrobium clamense TaxID=2851013 RepID=UPI0031F2E1F7